MMKRTSDLRISRSDALPLSHRDFTVSDEIIKFDISLITDFSNDYILNRMSTPGTNRETETWQPCSDGGFQMYFIFSSYKRFPALPSFP